MQQMSFPVASSRRGFVAVKSNDTMSLKLVKNTCTNILLFGQLVFGIHTSVDGVTIFLVVNQLYKALEK